MTRRMRQLPGFQTGSFRVRFFIDRLALGRVEVVFNSGFILILCFGLLAIVVPVPSRFFRLIRQIYHAAVKVFLFVKVI